MTWRRQHVLSIGYYYHHSSYSNSSTYTEPARHRPSDDGNILGEKFRVAMVSTKKIGPHAPNFEPPIAGLLKRGKGGQAGERVYMAYSRCDEKKALIWNSWGEKGPGVTTTALFTALLMALLTTTTPVVKRSSK